MNPQFLEAIRRIYAQHYGAGRNPRGAAFLQRVAHAQEAQYPGVQRALGLMQFGA